MLEVIEYYHTYDSLKSYIFYIFSISILNTSLKIQERRYIKINFKKISEIKILKLTFHKYVLKPTKPTNERPNCSFSSILKFRNWIKRIKTNAHDD